MLDVIGSGSSPRLWGTRDFTMSMSFCLRFIPTAVGNAGRKPPVGAVKPVHPQGCGERNVKGEDGANFGGSSPRLWGTRNGPARTLPSNRFIPTAVGNAGPIMWSICKAAVHPHGCGERYVDIAVRGNGVRFIPTAVGNASNPYISEKSRTVHPHGCGERASNRIRRCISNGSSPRLWGTLVGTYQGVKAVRFIPTAVGNASPVP